MCSGGAQHAPRFLLLHEPAPGPLVRIVETGAMDDDAGGVRLTDVSLFDQLTDAHADREKAELIVHHGHGSYPLSDPLHVPRFGEVSGHGLLAENVLAGFERGDHHAVMTVGG